MGRDGRVHAESERPPLSVHGTLSLEAWSIAEHRGVAGPGDHDDVFMVARFIEKHLIYVAKHAQLVVDLDRAVRDLLGQLRPVTGDGRKRIGNCPAFLRDEQGTATDVVCGAKLYGPSAVFESVRCHACGAEWACADQLELCDHLLAGQSAA
jgi:hypothetical protein